MHSLHKRSFGIIVLLLALVAIAPGFSIVAGLLLMIPAFQMIMGKAAPVFPHRIATHPLPARYLAAVLQRSVPVLRYLEYVVHPRWHTPIEATKRIVGAAVFLLSVTLVFFPLPLSNVVPALAIALLSLAYLEEDGVLLLIALLTAVIILAPQPQWSGAWPLGQDGSLISGNERGLAQNTRSSLRAHSRHRRLTE